MKQGYFFWLTGLAGAGKTSIGNSLVRLLREQINVIHLDGDIVREILNLNEGKGGYDPEERKALGFRYAKLGHMIMEQGVSVVCSTISLYPEIHEFNRKFSPKYFEVFINVDMEILIQRDQGGIYSSALSGNRKNVMGIDIPLIKPFDPHLTINNNGERSIDEQAQLIFESAERLFGLGFLNDL